MVGRVSAACVGRRVCLMSWVDRWICVVLGWIMMLRTSTSLVLADLTQAFILRMALCTICSVALTDAVLAETTDAVFILLTTGSIVCLHQLALVANAFLVIQSALSVINALNALIFSLAAKPRIAHEVVTVAASSGSSSYLL